MASATAVRHSVPREAQLVKPNWAPSNNIFLKNLLKKLADLDATRRTSIVTSTSALHSSSRMRV